MQRVTEQNSALTEDLRSCQNTAEAVAQQKLDEVSQEKAELQREIERLRDHIDQLQQVGMQCHAAVTTEDTQQNEGGRSQNQ